MTTYTCTTSVLAFNASRSIAKSFNYFLFNKKLLLTTAAVFATMLLFICSDANAQFNSTNMGFNDRSGYGLVFGATADVPMHNLKDVYKAAPAFELGVIKDLNHFTVGLNIGYRQYPAKYSSYVDHDSYGNADGTISFSPYHTFSIYASAVYNFQLSNEVSLAAGLNTGTYISSYSYKSNTSNGLIRISDSYNPVESQAYVAPRLGLNFAVSNDVQIGIQTRYNIFGNATYTYNTTYGSSSSGTIYTSWASGVSLTYRFP